MPESPHAVKTRFAPTPTGGIHLGNARTALFNFLFARRTGGRFLLRLEDTDAERGSDASVEALQADLHWLGLEWDEGPDRDASGGPYRQSLRGDIYLDFYQRLTEEDAVYPCFCSREALAASRKRQLAAGRPPRYEGTCARISHSDRRRRIDAGESHTLRFRVAPGRQVNFVDQVRGEQHFASDDIGDFVIRRADGSPALFFCNALDDALMGVTHVLRGADHLSNTARQLLLLETLNLAAPAYGHLPLLLDSDGGPLSKRAGSLSARELRSEGMLPTALCNYMARLGHHMDDDALLGFDGLATLFDVTHVGRSPGRFDAAQLAAWQRRAVDALDAEALARWVPAAALTAVPAQLHGAFLSAVQPNVHRPAEVADWAHRLFGRWQPDHRASEAIREAGEGFFACALEACAVSVEDPSGFVPALKRCAGVSGRRLFMPLRMALTGVDHGPDIKTLLNFLPPERVSERLSVARTLAAQP